jgi:hypothetical protein
MADTFGQLIKECNHTCPLGQFAEATYDGADYNGGPAIRISSASGIFAMHGLAAVYAPAQNRVALVLYDGEPLSGIGSEILSYAVTLVAGDVLRIEASTTDTHDYSVKINAIEVLSVTLTDAQLSSLNPCVGFVRVVTVPPVVIPPPSDDEADVLIIKPSNQSKTSDIVLADDPDFSFAIGASEKWVVKMALRWTAGNTAKVAFTGPAGCAGWIWDDEYNFHEAVLGTSLAENLGGGLPIFITANFQNGGTAGTVHFQWAQSASSATTTTLGAGSHMVGWKS